jgi:lipopolysaccharide transport system permease protein
MTAPPETEVPADAPPRDPPVLHRTVIEPPSGWQLLGLRELWRYRELLLTFVVRDVKVRYKQTVLGAAWAVLQPAMMMAVFTVLFGKLANLPTGGVPEPLFYLSGLLPWFFFSTAVTTGANSVLGASGMITKVYFPRLAVPLSAVGAALVDFLISCGLLAVMLLAYGVAPTWQLLVAPLVVAIVGLFALGLGTGFAALNVVFRDFRYVVPFAVQLGMYATPAIYFAAKAGEAETPSDTIRLLIQLNPLNSLITAFRAATVGGDIPWAGVGIAGLLSVATFFAGCLYFRRVEDRFADVI